jgi:hypothetical protein
VLPSLYRISLVCHGSVLGALGKVSAHPFRVRLRLQSRNVRYVLLLALPKRPMHLPEAFITLLSIFEPLIFPRRSAALHHLVVKHITPLFVEILQTDLDYSNKFLAQAHLGSRLGVDRSARRMVVIDESLPEFLGSQPLIQGGYDVFYDICAVVLDRFGECVKEDAG